jgi:hypothetical protein
MNKGTTMPSQTASAWKRNYGAFQHGVYWSPEVRQRIASQLQHIRHWSISQASYENLPDIEATWFIDAPYDSEAGEHYKHGRRDIDYEALGVWCKERRGQVIVCEAWGAGWLPFGDFGTSKGQRKPSREVIWTNGEGHPADHAESERKALYLNGPFKMVGSEAPANDPFLAQVASGAFADYTLHFHAFG